ncbi:MAG: TIM barrel protein [Methanosarcinales archaeon]|nr:MAG: TIM barrel protein [Methanosarcinales archaeon]
MNLIKVGIAGIPLAKKGKGMEAGIQYLFNIGLDAMEVQFTRGIFMDSVAAKKVGQLAKKLGIKLSVHAPYYVNLASTKKKIIEKSKQFIINSAKIASKMGATIVVFHAAYYLNDTNDTFALVRDACEVVGNEISDDVRLGIETTGRQKQFGTLDEIARLMTDVDKIIPVLDFAHIHARGNGSLRRKEDFIAVFDKFDQTKFHIHFTGVEYSNGNEKKHIPLNDELNFRHLAEVLVKREYDATVICESPLLERDALKMKEIIVDVQG